MSNKVVFRKIENKNAKWQGNGTPIYKKGENRHEHNDTLGHVQTREIIENDLKMSADAIAKSQGLMEKVSNAN